ncbi:MAG: hypothetical protein K0U13_00125 [Chlamydiae bacterium]|nr:hypothetical protein [Chlamydiota bacterium]
MVRFSNEGVELMGRGNIGDLEVEPHTPACALCNIEAVGYNERGYTLIRSPAGYPLIIPTSDNPPVTFLAMSLNQRAEIVRLADRFITELKEQTEGEDYRLVFPCGRPAGQRQWHAYGRIAAENLGDWQNNHYDTFPPR